MSSLSWDDRLNSAESEKEILDIAREYVARLDHSEVAALPLHCRPRKMMDAGDISSYALDLMEHDCGDDDAIAALVTKLAAFFCHAAGRLSRILGKVNDANGAFEESA